MNLKKFFLTILILGVFCTFFSIIGLFWPTILPFPFLIGIAIFVMSIITLIHVVKYYKKHKNYNLFLSASILSLFALPLFVLGIFTTLSFTIELEIKRASLGWQHPDVISMENAIRILDISIRVIFLIFNTVSLVMAIISYIFSLKITEENDPFLLKTANLNQRMNLQYPYPSGPHNSNLPKNPNS